MKRVQVAFLLFGILAASLAGCSGIVGAEQPWADRGRSLSLGSGETAGQTFVANQTGLAGIEVFLSPETSGQGAIHLHLRASPTEATDLAQTTLPLNQVIGPAFHRFTFTPQPASTQRDYYLLLEVVGDGSLRVGSTTGEAYLDGAAYQNGEPLDAQLAFRLVYEPVRMGLGMIGQLIGWLGILGLAIFLYVLPGWACLNLMGDRSEPTPWAAKLGLSAGIALALYPLLFLWTDLVGARLGPLYAWGPGLMGITALAWRNRSGVMRKLWEGVAVWRSSAAFWPDVTLLVLMALIFFARFFAIRLLVAPSWGDSVQHAVMTQLILDHGGLFDSWQPYAAYQTLTVQFGFSAASALLAWLSGWSSTQATLVTGQMLNGLAILAMYPLAVRLTGGNRWAGVGAVLVGGLLSPMPAYYVNWGRYAQLAGQAVLPAALWLLLEVIQSHSAAWKKAILAGAVLAGMTLTYYRMPFYYAVFALAWLVVWGSVQWGLNVRRWWAGSARLAIAAVAAVFLFAPWAARVYGGRLAQAIEAGVNSSSPLESVLADYQVWRQITFYMPWFMIVIAFFGLGGSLIQRRSELVAIGLWVIGLASLVATRLIRLPGANMMQNFAVIIMLYLPASLLSGWVIGQLAQSAERLAAKLAVPLLSMGIIVAAGWGAWTQLGIVQPQFIMVTAADVRAMAWIRANTPPDARFLVEGFRIYNGQSAVGADAGWWLPLLAGRENTMPPQYAMLNEQPATAGYTQQLVDVVARLETISPTSAEGVRFLCDQGITHAYIGQRQGNVGLGVTQLYTPDDFANASVFTPVYHEDRVYVFALNPQACENNP